MAEPRDPNINRESNTATSGMNLERSVSQVPKGVVTYALNAAVENFDANGINYQNEPRNEFCVEFPQGFHLVGTHFIVEQSKHIFFLANPETGQSEVGYMDNNDCVYRKYINADCLDFNVNNPIHKIVHKINNCTTKIYWADPRRRFLDLNNLPFKTAPGTDVCNDTVTDEIDCNKLSIQPNFRIPSLDIIDVVSGGNLTAGTVQFAIQYSDANGNGYTSYYSVTNPTPIADTQIITPNFNYPVGKSVVVNISNLDNSGYFEYFNLAVIKTINNITSVELVGTYFIDAINKQITYSGQNQTQIRLTIGDIFTKFPYYELADDLTSVQDILVWKGLTAIDRINYQQIANKITLEWETWRIPDTENYSDELNATNFRGYLRDEVYPFEIVFLLTNGKQTDGFHIPGRVISAAEKMLPEILPTDPDFIGDVNGGNVPYWKVYNTASVTATDPDYTPYSDYKGSYQYGQFAYWQSLELYPCNTDIWGDLANTPIRHHKFPDLLVSPIFENPVIEVDSMGKYTNLAMQKNAVFPIGIRLNISQVKNLINQSNLTSEQKAGIVGFKIVRGNRDVNKSIIAKGILRNVGKYTREDTEYYFPNYPYNDLREDPFLLTQNNGYNSQCNTYRFTATSDGIYQYTDCFKNSIESTNFFDGNETTVCSLSTPVILSGTTSAIEEISYDTYIITVTTGFVIFRYIDADGNEQFLNLYSGESSTIQVEPASAVDVVLPSVGAVYNISQIDYLRNEQCYPERLSAFETDDSRYRHVFNSPETSFGQPFLGNVLKLENVLFGVGKGHFVEVKKNALYRLISREAQIDALESSGDIASVGTFTAEAMFTAYQAYLQIYLNGITRKNYGWSYNSILNYNYYSDVENEEGIKQRMIESIQYLIPGVQSVGDTINVNNYQRESSVYIKTTETVDPLPFPSETPSLVISPENPVVEDKSRYINSQWDCSDPGKQFDISSVVYYASLKNIFDNQWGQMYSYETIDTGFQQMIDNETLLSLTSNYATIFGGDTFISGFSFKIKLPFFIDNRVGAPDESDVFYDEIGNVAYPEYWHSARAILYDYTYETQPVFKNIISIKAHNLDCPNNQLPAPNDTTTPPIVNPDRSFYDGKMYMFAYGIPTFYCESSINVDLRQAFNNREGDFYPHVSSGIPDDWLQESFVPIVQDNTYYYNVTYSKQNEENNFTHLPVAWEEKLCFTTFPFRAIYSDTDGEQVDGWLVYRPLSMFDFPQNYGELISLDGIQNKAILARFENKSLLYNTLLTINTSNPQAAYIGGSSLFTGAPPIDFAETDLGYVGTQHKFLLKIPQGQITVDAKRGQIFLIAGNTAKELSALGLGLTRFLTDHLPFEILTYFPSIDIDNHFNGIGLHGVYDSKYDRVIISKLDYTPLTDEVKWDEVTNEFYIELVFPQYNTTTTTTTNGESPTTTTTVAPLVIRKRVYLSDSEYFCNKSWTLSYNLNTQSWVSFHSYIPNWYIAENNFFYSGLNIGCDLEIIAFEEGFTTSTTSTSSTSTTTTSTSSTTTTTTTTVAPTTTTTTSTSSTTTSTSTSTTTTTSTTSSTTTTTTTLPSMAIINTSNVSLDIVVNSITVNGVPATPISPSSYETDQIGTFDIVVNYTSAIGGQHITVIGSDSVSSCQNNGIGTGVDMTFVGIVIDVIQPVVVDIADGPC
jgi:hypothetical protein